MTPQRALLGYLDAIRACWLCDFRALSAHCKGMQGTHTKFRTGSGCTPWDPPQAVTCVLKTSVLVILSTQKVDFTDCEGLFFICVVTFE